MTRLLSFLASVAVASSLVFRSVTPASACSCAQPSLDELVAATEVIVIGSAGEFFTRPPLDPSTPDTLQHLGYVRFATDEYLKGGGPTELSVGTGTSFAFNNGGVVEGTSTCSVLSEGSAGRRYVLFLSGPLENAPGPGTCSGSTMLTHNPGADSYLQSLRATLQLTPSEGSPDDLPRTGGKSESDPSGVVIAITAAMGTLVLGAGLVWRNHNQRRV